MTLAVSVHVCTCCVCDLLREIVSSVFWSCLCECVCVCACLCSACVLFVIHCVMLYDLSFCACLCLCVFVCVCVCVRPICLNFVLFVFCCARVCLCVCVVFHVFVWFGCGLLRDLI